MTIKLKIINYGCVALPYWNCS